MTRAGFLRLVAAAPLARAFGQSSAPQTQGRPNQPAPRSGSLIVAGSGGVWLVEDTGYDYFSSPRDIAPSEGPTVLVAPDRRVFVCSATRPGVDPARSHLTVIDLSNRHATADYPYPGPLSMHGVALALSADGHRLYTLTGRESPDMRWRRAGQGGSSPEMAVVYIFDTERSQFLPLANESGQEFHEGMVLIERSAQQVEFGPTEDGKTGYIPIHEMEWAPVTMRPARGQSGGESKPGAFQAVVSPDGRTMYSIQSDGHAVRWDPGTWYGGVDGVAPGRFPGDPAVSGDGKLLFLPSVPRPLTQGPPRGATWTGSRCTAWTTCTRFASCTRSGR